MRFLLQLTVGMMNVLISFFFSLHEEDPVRKSVVASAFVSSVS